jgi:hypothetical protein
MTTNPEPTPDLEISLATVEFEHLVSADLDSMSEDNLRQLVTTLRAQRTSAPTRRAANVRAAKEATAKVKKPLIDLGGLADL